MTSLARPRTPPLTPRPALSFADARADIQVLGDVVDVDAHAEAWGAVARRIGAGIQHTWPWLKVWWSVYGGSRALRVVLLHDDDELVAVIPLVIDTVRIGPARLRLARLAGTDHTQVLGRLIVHPGWQDAAVHAAARLAFDDAGCDALVLGPLSAEAGDLDAARRAVIGAGTRAVPVRDRVTGTHMTFALPDTFDAWMRALSKNARKSMRKGMTRLEREGDVETSVLTDPARDPGALDAFIDMHQRQWRDAGMPGHFRDWPHAAEFHRRLADALAPLGAFHLLRLQGRGTTVAQHLTHLHGSRAHWLLTGRRTGPEWQEYGLGKASLMKLVEDLIPRGVRALDACVGDYDYKERLGAERHDVATIVLAAPSRRAVRRTRTFMHAADALHLAYYRAWYGRLAPRLGIRRGGLNESWIRSRV